MSGTRFFKTHRSWEDWVGMLIGVLIGISPWLAEQQRRSSGDVERGSGRRGLCSFLRSSNTSACNAGRKSAKIALGLWLIASPFIFGYAEAGPLRYWHFVLGAIIALLATWELWQDWRLSDKELAQHGQ